MFQPYTFGDLRKALEDGACVETDEGLYVSKNRHNPGYVVYKENHTFNQDGTIYLERLVMQGDLELVSYGKGAARHIWTQFELKPEHAKAFFEKHRPRRVVKTQYVGRLSDTPYESWEA